MGTLSKNLEGYSTLLPFAGVCSWFSGPKPFLTHRRVRFTRVPPGWEDSLSVSLKHLNNMLTTRVFFCGG